MRASERASCAITVPPSNRAAGAPVFFPIRYRHCEKDTSHFLADFHRVTLHGCWMHALYSIQLLLHERCARDTVGEWPDSRVSVSCFHLYLRAPSIFLVHLPQSSLRLHLLLYHYITSYQPVVLVRFFGIHISLLSSRQCPSRTAGQSRAFPPMRSTWESSP